MEFLYWLEETPLSAAIAGSQYMYPAILAAHGMGMAVVAGLSWVISLRVLGTAPELPLAAMTRYSPIMWVGLGVNIVTGLLLTMAGASRVLIDPVFYVKMTFVALAVVNVQMLNRELRLADDVVGPMGGSAVAAISQPTAKVRNMAVASVFLWLAAITLGRLMAYSFFRFWR